MIKKLTNTKTFIALTILSAIILLLSTCSIIPYIKDYSIVSNSGFLEDDAILIEFTYIRNDPDGNGETQYSKPKFYIEEKNEYIILNLANVEVGKKYRIRYLPNTKLSEIVCCIQ